MSILKILKNSDVAEGTLGQEFDTVATIVEEYVVHLSKSKNKQETRAIIMTICDDIIESTNYGKRLIDRADTKLHEVFKTDVDGIAGRLREAAGSDEVKNGVLEFMKKKRLLENFEESFVRVL